MAIKWRESWIVILDKCVRKERKLVSVQLVMLEYPINTGSQTGLRCREPSSQILSKISGGELDFTQPVLILYCLLISFG